VGVGVVAFLLVVVAALALVTVVARRNKAAFLESNDVVPGIRTTAPEGWAGSHNPEALLHRRLRAAMDALRTNQSFDDDGQLLDLRVELEQQTLALDERLVAIGVLPERLRPEPLARATDSVERIEEAIASLVGASSSDAEARLSALISEIGSRTQLETDAWRDVQTAATGGAVVAPVDPLPTTAAPPVPPPPPPPPVTEPATQPATEPATEPPTQQPGTA
jgi:hypothetical protein